MIYIALLILFYLCYCIIPTLYFKLKEKKSIRNNTNNIYLTFDDGPDEVYTDKLLDLLNEYNVKATFFVVANKAKKQRNILERMVNEGHDIGLHSLEHKSAFLKCFISTKNDFHNSMKIMNDLNIDVTYYRPPWGHLNLFTLFFTKRHNLKLILWSVMVGDWSKHTTSDDIKSRLINRVKKGDIICLHDSRGSDGAPKKTITALEEVIPYLLNKNYKFKLLGDRYE